jgi:hypothetical protein
VILSGLAITACGSGLRDPVGRGGASSPSDTTSTSPSTSAVSSGRQVAPLTGLPVASAADAARPAVALDVAGPAPRGLSSADVVFEEITSPVRYIAVYQSRQGADVGPVTTTQPTDRAALAVLHPLIGYNGAAAKFFVKLLDRTKITDASDSHNPELYKSTAAGLVTSTQAISRAVSGVAAPPSLLPYRDVGPGGSTLAGQGELKRSSVRVDIPGSGTQHWTFDAHKDRWFLTSGGPRVQVANLIVQTVRYKQISVKPRRGIIVPSAQLTGAGRAEVFSGAGGGGTGGTAASGTWSKPHNNDVTNYFDSSGAPMAFVPGPTWIILAPPGTQVSASGA